MVEQQDLFQHLLDLRERPRNAPVGNLVTALFYAYVKVPLEHTGVLIRGCGVSDFDMERVDESLILPPGTYGIGFKERIIAINTSRKLFNEEYHPETNEGIPVTVGISMYCCLRPDYAPVFYRTYNSVDFENVLLRPCLQGCVEQSVGSTSITSFTTKKQAINEVGQPLQQLIKQMADGIGMDFDNLRTSFTPPHWQREFAESLASQQLNAEMTAMRRQITLLDGEIEAMIVRKRHEANQPTEADLELARVQAGSAELRKQMDLVQQLLISVLARQNNS